MMDPTLGTVGAGPTPAGIKTVMKNPRLITSARKARILLDAGLSHS